MYALLTIVRHLHGHVAGVRRDVEQPGICAHKQVLLAVLLHDSLDVEHGLLERNQMREQRFNDNFTFFAERSRNFELEARRNIYSIYRFT